MECKKYHPPLTPPIKGGDARNKERKPKGLPYSKSYRVGQGFSLAKLCFFIPLILLSQPTINLDYSLPYFSCYDATSVSFLNPASLASIDYIDLGLRIGSGTKGKGNFDLLRLQSNPLLGDLSLPMEVNFSQKGGIEYIGAAARMGNVVIGGGFHRGEFLRLRPETDTVISKRYSFEIPYYPVTRRDIPQLPSDTLLIPVNFKVEGEGVVYMHSEGEGKISTFPLFLSLATNLRGLALGIGIGITGFSGDINLIETDSGGFYNATVTAKTAYPIPIPDPYKWDMDVRVRGDLSEDTLWAGKLEGDISGVQLALRIGSQTEIAKIRIGGVIEQRLPANLGTLYSHTVYVSDIPKDIYSCPESLKVDTANQRVTGDWEMDFTDLPKESVYDTSILKMPMDTKLSLGIAYPLRNLSLSGGILISLYEFGLGLGISSPLQSSSSKTTLRRRTTPARQRLKESPISWGAKLGIHSRRYKIGDFALPAIWGFCIGNSLGYRGVEANFGLKIDTATLALLSLVGNSSVSSLGGLWFGIGYSF